MAKPKVLIVDDDERWLNFYRQSLGRSCRAIIDDTITGGQQLFEENPDVALIIMDACVPGDMPTTLELTRKIRKTFTGPMIATSSLYEIELLAAGCDHRARKGMAAIELAKKLLNLTS